MRLVLDTNTAVSGLIWQGTPGRIIDAGLAEKVRLLSSVPLLAELEGVLQRPKFQQALQRRGVKVSDLFDGYAALVGCVAPVELVGPICRDPDDDKVLAAAIGGDADLIVSGEDDLLALGNYDRNSQFLPSNRQRHFYAKQQPGNHAAGISRFSRPRIVTGGRTRSAPVRGFRIAQTPGTRRVRWGRRGGRPVCGVRAQKAAPRFCAG